jgi:hypothetical protein
MLLRDATEIPRIDVTASEIHYEQTELTPSLRHAADFWKTDPDMQ